jgi:hypothetical protein
LHGGVGGSQIPFAQYLLAAALKRFFASFNAVPSSSSVGSLQLSRGCGSRMRLRLPLYRLGWGRYKLALMSSC